MGRETDSCVVVVTGGCGFLGQHVVGLLQEYADHVTEIRVLDIMPYVNKLEYKDRKPVRDYVGSITDAGFVSEVCKGAHSVIHVASIVDTSLIPDEDKSYNINVKGTQNVIAACQKHGVERLIYCSTVEVVVGHDNIYGGNEENTTPKLHGHMFEAYGSTKMQAEQMVLEANCESLRTASLRPGFMYGELEWRSWGHIIGNYITKKTGVYFRFNCGRDARMEHAYVGNVAWSFVCAEDTLRKNDSKSTQAAGQCFFIGDESPSKGLFDFLAPFLTELNLKPFPVDIPISFFIYPLYLLLMILTLVSYFHKVNFAYGIPAFMCITRIWSFKYDKASRYLGYKPLYPYTEAKARTVKSLHRFRFKK